MSKSVLLSGASGALGSHITRELIDSGVKVYGLTHHKNPPEDLLNHELVQYSKTELSDENFIDTIPEEFFNVDAFVHAASAPPDLNITHKRPWTDYRIQFNTGFRSAVLISARVMKSLLQKNGCLINILSSYTTGDIPKGCTPYISQKYALLGWGLSLKKEMEPRGVKVYNLSPGVMDTPFLDRLDESVRYELLHGKRPTPPEKVASIINKIITRDYTVIEKNLLI